MAKKKAVVIACVAVALAVFFWAGAALTAVTVFRRYPAEIERTAAGGINPVTLDEAVAVAMEDAGVSSQEATVTNAEQALDHGVSVYRIEFYVGNTEYAYEIYEDTGTVYSKSKETVVVQNDAADGNGMQPDAGQDQPGSGAQSDVGQDQPGSGVQSDVGQNPDEIGGQSDVGQNSDGIGAQSGTGISGTGQLANLVEDIGLEKAKSIALNHAGCSPQEVHFSKAKFEKEHGSTFYEIEFYKDGMEYEYTIHAQTGEILEFETEVDD